MANNYNSTFTGAHNDEYDSRIEALETSVNNLKNSGFAIINTADFSSITLDSWAAASTGGYYIRLSSATLGCPQTILTNLLTIKITSYTGSWRIFDWETYGNDLCIYSNSNTSTTVNFVLKYYTTI